MPGWKPTAPRGPAPTPAEVGVRFAKTAPRTWQGNGFADAGAEWVALMGDVEVGRFDGRRGDVFGSRASLLSVTAWKQAVCREAAKGL